MDPLVCTPCGQTFEDKEKLSNHELRYHDKRVFTCDQCQKEVVGRVKLLDHRKKHKATTCKHCGLQITFGSASRHQNSCSSNDNKDDLLLSCDQCDYTTDRRDSLKRHKETVQHVNEAENHCASCNKTFKLKRHLNMHLKTPIHMKNNPENIVNSVS